MFRTAADVIRHKDMPEKIDAVLSGHIHRHQVLIRDLENRTLRTPVLYSGSIERTSFAERMSRRDTYWSGSKRPILIYNPLSVGNSGNCRSAPWCGWIFPLQEWEESCCMNF